jgi:hypothetical protein
MSPHYAIISTSLNGKAGVQIGLQFLGSNPKVDGLVALSNTTTMPEWSKGPAVVVGGWLRKYVKIFGFLV